MKKLYFRYGVMHSGKSMQIAAVSQNYEIQGKKIFIMIPKLGEEIRTHIQSRTGFQRIVDLCVAPDTNILEHDFSDIACVLVDEAQFLTKKQIDDLRSITQFCPVICYGLRTDWKGVLFDGAKRLLEVCDTIEEVKTTCWFCNRKGTMNRKLDISKEAVVDIEIIGEHKYVPTCWEHFT